MKSGYDIKFIQKDACSDTSKHLFSYIYTFLSPDTKHKYVIRAECHAEEVFVIKFYSKRHRKSDFKYYKLTNKGYVRPILLTTLKVLIKIIKQHPEASFAFTGSYTVDKKNNWTEPPHHTQRYKIYKKLAAKLIGTTIFEHYAYDHFSSYLLLNKKCGDITLKETLIREMFVETYNNLYDLA